ncbi:MAG: hypothetical protein IPH00_16810 [Flavobacteriales bacterium]|nr:hypothetical protein [Flavobacteriales bacterium]
MPSAVRHCEFSCNNINGAATTYPADGQAGIYSNMGEGQRFSCNVMDKTSNGALFNGLAADIDLSGNQFNRHKWGLHLSSSAIIGTQDHKGNRGMRNPHKGDWGRGMRTTLTHPTILPLQSANISGGNTEPPSWSPNYWFNTDPGTNYDCATANNGPYCEQFHALLNGYGITELDHLIARDSLENDPYTEESKCMLKGGLYKKLDDKRRVAQQ